MDPKRRTRPLPIVLPSDELRGITPIAFQRATRRCSAGDTLHRGLLRTATAISGYATRSCVPPSAKAIVGEALHSAEQWAQGELDEPRIKKLRSELFTASVEVEERTVQAVRASQATMPKGRHTAIDAHADAVVLRFVALGAYYAVSSAILCLDGVEEPGELDGVLRQASGALAYQSTGLGPARSPDIRSRAVEQAGWEIARPGAPEGHAEEAIAVQLLHEFLGSHWKDQADAQRAYLSDFIGWALPSEHRAS